MNQFKRLLIPPERTFLLLGPRGTGKSTWLRHNVKPKVVIDLLKSDQFIRYQATPSLLRKTVASLKPGDWVVIDEVQRVPELLNEVHYLYEEAGLHFALTGSSARKLRRANANLLAGRALRCDMFPLTFGEMLDFSRIPQAVEFGTLPPVIATPAYAVETLAAYVETYLKEEIAAEALTRSLEPFARFIRFAAQWHGQLLNVERLGSEAALKRSTVDNYFQILEDTLLGYRLPALRLGYRVKEAAHPKLYLFDAGVARAAAGWLFDEMPDTWRGFSFETLVLNEMRAYNSYARRMRRIFHYTVTGGFDVDFVVEATTKILNRPAAYVGVEVKRSSEWKDVWSKPLRELVAHEHSKFKACYGVYLGDEVIEDAGVTILGFAEFCRRLWAGALF